MITRWDATARVLRRTGFGTTGAEVDAAVSQGIARYVEAILTADPANDPGARATPRPDVAPIAPLAATPAWPSACAAISSEARSSKR